MPTYGSPGVPHAISNLNLNIVLRKTIFGQKLSFCLIGWLWWAIVASLIAANISAEQIIGMSGQSFVVGLAIAAYEWQTALVLLIVAAFFLPIFIKREIYTMPQFLDQR